LSEAGLAALASAPAGQAPAEVATHLAACARCQERLLNAERPAGETRPPAARQPYRNLLVFGLGLLLILAMLGITLVTLSGR